MSRYHSYINTAEKIITAFRGEMPFSLFIKKYFSSEKKYGSKDRKLIAGLCYNYFRLGHAVPNFPVQDKIKIAAFLCNNEPSPLMETINPEWNNNIQLTTTQKKKYLNNSFITEGIFPFAAELSTGIDFDAFCNSFLVQPDIFLRIRPEFKSFAIEKLNASGLPYSLIGENCIRLKSATDVENIFSINKEVVIQDFNSQKVLDYLKLHPQYFTKNKNDTDVISAWDCCAASGGKSILLYDILKGKINLTVSDIRASIIANLHQRFKDASIKNYKHFIADSGKENIQNKANRYDIIICDVPCTGSGTWSRTPDQLYFFNPENIATFCNTQKEIITKVSPHLNEGGLFFYITCSVFKKENEDQVNFIQEKNGLKLLEMQVLKGYHDKADSMFTAVFTK